MTGALYFGSVSSTKVRREAPLCPGCTYRSQGESGLCGPCEAKDLLRRRLDKEAVQITGRRDAWRIRTGTSAASAASAIPEVAAERQRKHRMLERIKPREPVDDLADPWELANVALLHLAHLKPASARNPRLADALDAVEEAIRRLAWGPD